MQKKSPKITIKFFLNKNVAPVQDDKERDYYPLYVMLIYNRKNTQIRSHFEDYVYTSLEAVEKESPGLMAFEEKMLRKLVEYIIKYQGEEEFSLNGISKKYEYLSISIFDAMDAYLTDKLKSFVFSTPNELSPVLNFDGEGVTALHLFKVAKLLFKGFTSYLMPTLFDEMKAYEKYLVLFPEPQPKYNFPIVLDWLVGNHQKELDDAYLKVFKKKGNDLKYIHSLIDEATWKFEQYVV